jgi:hypothetical protein
VSEISTTSGDQTVSSHQGWRRFVRKAAVILSFGWWIIKAIDWLFTSRGLNRVEFPQYSGKDLGDGGIQTLFGSDKDKKEP